jgi:YD repeat-containing protein
MKSKKDKNGVWIDYTYNALDQQTYVQVRGDTTQYISNSYYTTGQKKQETNRDITINYKYDTKNRLIEENDTWNTKKTFVYNDLGYRKELKVYQSNVLKQNLTYGYNSTGRLASVTEKDPANLSTIDNTTYTYNINGSRFLTATGNITYTANYYNSLGQLNALSNGFSEYSYGYYLDGNKDHEMDDGSGKYKSFTYDGLGRLKTEKEEVSYEGTTTKTYTYDYAGNRKTMTVTGGESYVTTYQYDKNNRLVYEICNGNGINKVMLYDYDNNGNLTKKHNHSGLSVESYKYNAFNQLTETKKDDEIPTTYKYRPDGLRLYKMVNGDMTRHIWDGSNIIFDME